MTRLLRGFAILLAAAARVFAADGGDTVAVIYNTNLPESRMVAEHYVERRKVPTNQMFGVDVNAASEAMSRSEFRDRMQRPIFDWLVAQKLFTPNPKKWSPAADRDYRFITNARIRYIVLCYGIPLKILRDSEIPQAPSDDLPEPLRGRNEAAVDADMALLPLSSQPFSLNGPVRNSLYLTTNAALLHPTNGIVMVGRLDGPTAAIARDLVDKAMQAETNGLWGRAYLDARGIAAPEYKLGDDWMRTSAEITRRMGFETVLDDKEATFSVAFPMSQIAFYAGWYDASASGPFTRPTVEFMPGAFAYHLHSFSATTLRSTNQQWVGPLLAKGATISFGSVDEPLLSGTPNVAAFLERLIYRRFSFAEAAYASQDFLSWQTTVVGDPLYRPFAQPPDVLHHKLERENNPLVSWSHLRVVGLNDATGLPVAESLKYLDGIPTTRRSAVLTEKEGDLRRSQKRLSAAVEAYTAAVKLDPSLQQKVRLLLAVGELQSILGREQEAFDAYLQLVTEMPDNPNASAAYHQLAGLARKLNRKSEAEKFTRLAEESRPPK